MKALVLTMALLAPGGAFAQRFTAETATPTGASKDAFRAEVAAVDKVAHDPASSEYAVWIAAQNFFGRVPATTPVVRPDLRGWDYGHDAVEGREATTKDLLNTAKKRMTDLDVSVPVPEAVKASFDAASELQARDRLRYDEGMSEEQKGVYRYVKEKVDSGLIELNESMSILAAYIGNAFAYATIAHEADHRRRHVEGRLSPDRVIDGEISAFRTQYQWVVLVDPYNERLPYRRQVLQNRLRRRPGDARALDALKYLEHLALLRETGGDEEKLRDFVKKLGYAEGHQHDDAAHPDRA